MNFKQVDIYTKSEAIEILVLQLSELGLTGFSIHDSSDFEDFLENKDSSWDYVDDSLMGLKTVETHITAYVHDNVQGLELLSGIRSFLSHLKSKDKDGFYGELRIELDNVREEDWENNWKEFYKPFTVGEKLIIKPSWEEINNTDNRLVLEIDPASTFGTGQHHTTKLCMEALEKLIEKKDKLLDLGCGSGILSVAGLLLGAESAVLVDIFENAVVTAGENVEKNGFDSKSYKAYCGNIIDDELLREKIGTGYDVITANIVADVIISMSGLFPVFLKKQGTLIVSGIITERLEEVMAALKANNISIKYINEQKGWNAIICKTA